ncbi:phage tail protein [Lysinibacillus sp. NPDC094403]|uniref:phage tail protein n=1 Tax=Lysinibacillus sp. NPDC094403 TaxID=3390581 RepID=UPI003D04BF7C
MSQYYTLLTPIGLAKVANAQVTQSTVAITQIAVGDGNAASYAPTGKETTLKNEKWRGAITSVSVDNSNPNWVVVDAILPGNIGGFTLREVGLFDIEGDLIAIGNYPDTYKPVVGDGSIMDLTIRTIIEVDNASSVTLKIDPNVIIASRPYVDGKVAQVQKVLIEHSAQIATTGKLGHIKPDGKTITVDPSTGIASADSTETKSFSGDLNALNENGTFSCYSTNTTGLPNNESSDRVWLVTSVVNNQDKYGAYQTAMQGNVGSAVFVRRRYGSPYWSDWLDLSQPKYDTPVNINMSSGWTGLARLEKSGDIITISGYARPTSTSSYRQILSVPSQYRRTTDMIGFSAFGYSSNSNQIMLQGNIAGDGAFSIISHPISELSLKLDLYFVVTYMLPRSRT